MEQVQGGDLVVNRGAEARPRDVDGARDMHAVEGLEPALKLAQASLDELMKTSPVPPPAPAQSGLNPTTTSQVFLRLQPFTSALALPGAGPRTHMQFVVQLVDPEHQLAHTTLTQAVPGAWLSRWDEFDWVEDLVAEALRVGVEVVGQEYIAARMGWITKDGAGDEAEGEEEEEEDTEDEEASEAEEP
jgi:hypothetical protein